MSTTFGINERTYRKPAAAATYFKIGKASGP